MMMSTSQHFSTAEDKLAMTLKGLSGPDSAQRISKISRVLPKLNHNHLALNSNPKITIGNDKELFKIRPANVKQEKESLYDDVLNQRMISNNLK